MILSGLEIEKEINKNIFISDFDRRKLNPNSYNLSIGNQLIVYDEDFLDLKKKHKTKIFTIPEQGIILYPCKTYLAQTVEYTKTHRYVPMIEGRSSIGRLGLSIHTTAGFGDVGFEGFWTLQLSCIQAVKIYPYIEICQIYYHTIQGEYFEYNAAYKSKYQGNNGIQPSMLYREFKEEK